VKFLAFLIVPMLSIVGCSHGTVGTVVTVTNQSPGAISNISISGIGFSNHLGVLLPGESRDVTVRPTAESGVALAFDTAGRRVDSGAREHVEPSVDFQLMFIVKRDLSISTGSGVRHAVDK
jgi:hypothetical protein